MSHMTLRWGIQLVSAVALVALSGCSAGDEVDAENSTETASAELKAQAKAGKVKSPPRKQSPSPKHHPQPKHPFAKGKAWGCGLGKDAGNGNGNADPSSGSGSGSGQGGASSASTGTSASNGIGGAAAAGDSPSGSGGVVYASSGSGYGGVPGSYTTPYPAVAGAYAVGGMPGTGESICGNGIREWESCDDGNVLDGDGCSASCEVELGFNCDDGACTAVVCGDRKTQCAPTLDGSWNCESCDDGNTASGDGCDATCNLEPGWSCSGDSCGPTCGNGYFDCSYDVDTGEYNCETCDDGNVLSGDGCNSQCQTEVGWDCYNGACAPAACGNQIYECPMQSDGMIACESCEDGNTTSGDGCSATCELEAGWSCDGTSCYQVVCGDGRADCTPGADGNYLCESCDDGNTESGDGCSSSCQSEYYGSGGAGGYSSWGSGPTAGSSFVGSVGGAISAGGSTGVGGRTL